MRFFTFTTTRRAPPPVCSEAVCRKPCTKKRAFFSARGNVYITNIFSIHYKSETIMSVIAYVRVSTQEQPFESQEYEIKRWCREHSLDIDGWVTESVSGTVSWEKRMLGKAIRRMRSGDLLVCSEISRLGRNMLMIMSILNICSQKGLRIHTIKDDFDLADNINSKIIAFAFALAAEIERNLISQRTREALAAKKTAGVNLGRPKGHSEKVQRICSESGDIEALIASGSTMASVAKLYNVHRNTLARLRRMNYRIQPGEAIASEQNEI